MGKKNKTMRNDASRKIVVPFRLLNSGASAANLKVFALNAGTILFGTTIVGATTDAGSTRLNAIAVQNTLFRFKKLKVTLHPEAGIDQALCYVMGADGVAAPSTVPVCMEQLPSLYVPGGITVPKSITINRNVLAGQFPWYRINSVADNAERIQGYIFLVSSTATPSLDVIIEGEVEYKGFNNSGVAIPRPLDSTDLLKEINRLRDQMVTSKSVTG